MALFAIGDLHLSFGTNKPMDIFRGWDDYVNRLESNWRAIISPEDTIVLCGDISWAMNLKDTVADFTFIQSLPGRKIIIKGNHDYWWTTKAKMDRFLVENGFDSMSILFNNSYDYGDFRICGSRGWSYDCPKDEMNVLLRECGRLRMSLDYAGDSGKEPICFLHYPPVYSNYRCDEIMSVLKEYSIRKCYYAHLHGQAQRPAVIGQYEGIDMRLIAADYTAFAPTLICR